MGSEHAVILYLNDIICVVLIILFQMLKDLKFDPSLVLELLLVADDLDGNDLFSLVVDALQGLPEGSFAKEVDNFESVGDVVPENHIIISVFIIEAVVELRLPFLDSRDLLSFETQEEHLLVVEDLSLLIHGHL